MTQKLNTIDLFAGAGGLSLGFMKTGCFDIKVAIEYDQHAAKTYSENHEGVEVLQEDAAKISFKEKIEDIYGKIDVVIGGPPCQGFSNANRQKTSLISGNNQLVQHYVRSIEELAPKAFILENVKTLESNKHFFFVGKKNIDLIQRLNIPLKKEKVSVCSGEMPTALITGLLQHIDDVNMYRMNEEGYTVLCTLLKFSRTNKRARSYIKVQGKKVKKMLDNWSRLHTNFWDDNWKEFYLDSMNIIRNFVDNLQGYVAYFERLKIIVEVERTVERLHELRENGIKFEARKFESNIVVFADTFSVKDYLEHKFAALGYIVNKAILNAADFGVPQTRERFIMIGIKKEFLRNAAVQLPSPIVAPENYFTVQDAIEDLEQLEPSIQIDTSAMHAITKGHSKLASLLCDNPLIWNHIVTDTGKIAKERFKALEQGENFHNLDVSMKKTYSLPERTQNTIYLRLQYAQPSGTVMNVRKSMWIHPILDRALSIREAARLQSFPNSFVFFGTKNAQYQQVGNAVPPLLGQAIAECLLEQLGIRSKSSLTDDLRINGNESDDHNCSSKCQISKSPILDREIFSVIQG